MAYVISSAFHLLELTTICTCCVAIVYGIVDAFCGLFAKRSAKALLSKLKNPKLDDIKNKIALSNLDNIDVGWAAGAIFSSLEDLPKSKRHYVRQGLFQSNKAGEKRYIEELMN